ncbi:MAG TPA: phage portal protein [Terracidiphilus sp.]|nr:phage portal protein [Terracidiphilus sp.]
MASPSLNSKGKPSWPIRAIKGIFRSRIDPETYEQSQGITMTRYGLVKSAGGKFGEIDTGGNQFAIERPGGGHHIDPEKALANNRGYVYAAVNAKAREVQNIDFRLFEVDGEDHNEKEQHPLLDLLDGVNPDMIGSELKYLTSSHLDLVGNCYWLLTDSKGNPVKGDLDKPEAIYLLDPSRVHPVIDKNNFPYHIVGYKMKLETRNVMFDPACIIHFRSPDPMNFYEGRGIVQAGAEFIDNDNYAMEFNRKFFVNGARPAGFLETEMVSETQVESLKIGFMDVHGGIDNMQRIGVLPKGVKWAPAGSSPKDMDFKNLSEDMRDRILALFGVSKTILGTAESDTNRATAETADYVFSKRVVKPHMQRICDFLNEKLVPRYGDDLYISFIDPVPEDRGARTTEMSAAVGSQPVLTINEARDEFMGLGPVEGGDQLMAPSTMAPVGEPTGDGDVAPEAAGGEEAGKRYRKAIEAKVQKAANGQRVAFRPARTKLTSRAKARSEMAKSLTETIKEKLQKSLAVKKFESTKAEDEARWKEWSDYTEEAEKDIAATIRKINAEQKKEVLANLPHAINKAIDPKDLFSVEKWISITTDAMTPIMETLFDHQARAAAAEIGKPELNPFNDTTRAAVKRSVQMMSESYQQTTLTVLETKINDGLQAGAPLPDIAKTVEEIYEWSDEKRAATVAKTESFRTANDALKTAWKQSGVVKTVRWYTSELPNVCAICLALNGREIGIDDVFFKNGESFSAEDADGTTHSMTFEYGDVEAPPAHPLCACFIRPSTVQI